MSRRLAAAILLFGCVCGSPGHADEQAVAEITAALDTAKSCPALGVNTDAVQSVTQQLLAENAQAAPIVNTQGDYSSAFAGNPLPGGPLEAQPPEEEPAPPPPLPAPEGLSGDCLQIYVDYGPDGAKYPGLFYLVDYETQPKVAPDSQSGGDTQPGGLDDSQSRGDINQSSSDGSERGASQ